MYNCIKWKIIAELFLNVVWGRISKLYQIILDKRSAKFILQDDLLYLWDFGSREKLIRFKEVKKHE